MKREKLYDTVTKLSDSKPKEILNVTKTSVGSSYSDYYSSEGIPIGKLTISSNSYVLHSPDPSSLIPTFTQKTKTVTHSASVNVASGKTPVMLWTTSAGVSASTTLYKSIIVRITPNNVYSINRLSLSYITQISQYETDPSVIGTTCLLRSSYGTSATLTNATFTSLPKANYAMITLWSNSDSHTADEQVANTRFFLGSTWYSAETTETVTYWYNSDIAQADHTHNYSDLNAVDAEEWTFTLDDGSTVTRKVLVYNGA